MITINGKKESWKTTTRISADRAKEIISTMRSEGRIGMRIGQYDYYLDTVEFKDVTGCEGAYDITRTECDALVRIHKDCAGTTAALDSTNLQIVYLM